jgi:hypothetical protein
LMATIIESMNTARELIPISYLIFRVQPDQEIGYSFFVDYPIGYNDHLVSFQFFGFIIVLSGLFWVARFFILDLFKPMHDWIQDKKATSI